MKKQQKIAFLHPYPFNTAGGQRFRYEQYIDVLRENGFELTFHSFLSEKAWEVLYQPGRHLTKVLNVLQGFWRRFLLLFSLGDSDYVFIFREVSPLGPPVFEYIIAKWLKKKIIYDFDDAIWLENTSSENRFVARLKWHSKVKQICVWSYKVSVGNAFLADYARQFNKHVVINPTTVDTQYHQPGSTGNGEQIIVGWTGTHSTVKYLTLVEDMLQRITKKYRHVEVLVICDKQPALPFDYTYTKWSEESEVADLQRLNIGIMPLLDTPWEKGKCGFKAIQYMAVGVPALVSPVGVNTKIVDHGENGFHCSSPEDWELYLEKLIEDAELRQKMGQRAVEKIESHYSKHSNAENVLSLFR